MFRSCQCFCSLLFVCFVLVLMLFVGFLYLEVFKCFVLFFFLYVCCSFLWFVVVLLRFVFCRKSRPGE